MGLGFVLFNIRQRKAEDNGFLAVMIYTLRNQKSRKAGQGFFDVARAKFGDEAGDGPLAVLKIMVVFSMVSFFWALFDQHASAWLEQAKAMDLALTVPHTLFYAVVASTLVGAVYGGAWLMLHVSNVKLPRKLNLAVLAVMGASVVAAGIVDVVLQQTKTVELEYAQVAALNPLMVMMIIPLLNVGVWEPLAKRGIQIRPLQKMTAGMFMAAAAFVIAAFLQTRIEAAGPRQGLSAGGLRSPTGPPTPSAASKASEKLEQRVQAGFVADLVGPVPLRHRAARTRLRHRPLRGGCGAGHGWERRERGPRQRLREWPVRREAIGR
jgi:hypothetical protein